jgi:hypothetical protein
MSNVSDQKMRHFLTHCLLCLVAVSGAYAVEPEYAVPTTYKSQINYPWISFLTEGPADWFSDSETRGRYLRLVVYGQVEEYPSTFRIETITYGDEGCCHKLSRARNFELAPVMAGKFGPLSTDAIEFEFVRWLNSTSVEFKYRGQRFVLLDLHQNTLRVKRESDRSPAAQHGPGA